MSNEPTCNHVSDGRRCGEVKNHTYHAWKPQGNSARDHKFEPGRPEEPKVGPVCGDCGRLKWVPDRDTLEKLAREIAVGLSNKFSVASRTIWVKEVLTSTLGEPK